MEQNFNNRGYYGKDNTLNPKHILCHENNLLKCQKNGVIFRSPMERRTSQFHHTESPNYYNCHNEILQI